MIGIIFMLMGGFSIIKVGNAEALVMIGFCLIGPLVLLYNKSNVIALLACPKCALPYTVGPHRYIFTMFDLIGIKSTFFLFTLSKNLITAIESSKIK